MQFHSQVWFTLAPIRCLKGWWRLRIFTLSNYQPLCPPTGLVNPFSTFLGVTECISAALSLIFELNTLQGSQVNIKPPCLC